MTKNEIQYVETTSLHQFRNHPFQIRDDEDMERLVESVSQQGIIDPIIVRVRPVGGFEIVSGHRRHHAAVTLGMEKVPVVIRDISDDEAVLAMVDANLHREELLPSERAFAYKMKLEALSHQGRGGNPATSRQVVGKLETADMVGKETGDSGRQVQRYIRLTRLHPELLALVDDRVLKLNTGVELSYLNAEEQTNLLEIMSDVNMFPSLEQAKELHQMSRNGECGKAAIFKLLSLKETKERRLVIREEKLMQYLQSNMTDEEMEETIFKLLDKWRDGRC